MDAESFRKELNRHRNVNDAKFSFVLERIKDVEQGLRELKEESNGFYDFIGDSIYDLPKEVGELKSKVDKLL
ncbi:MAG: hypothetical protein AAF944_18305 [Bacteroidota bacterium]